MALGPTLIQYNLILTWLYLQSPVCKFSCMVKPQVDRSLEGHYAAVYSLRGSCKPTDLPCWPCASPRHPELSGTLLWAKNTTLSSLRSAHPSWALPQPRGLGPSPWKHTHPPLPGEWAEGKWESMCLPAQRPNLSSPQPLSPLSPTWENCVYLHLLPNLSAKA